MTFKEAFNQIMHEFKFVVIAWKPGTTDEKYENGDDVPAIWGNNKPPYRVIVDGRSTREEFIRQNRRLAEMGVKMKPDALDPGREWKFSRVYKSTIRD